MSLPLYFGPLLEVSQTGKRTKPLLFNRPDYFCLSVNSGLRAQDKNRKRDGKMMCISLFISKKTPKQGWDSQIHCTWQPVFHQPCSADGEKKYVSGAFSLIVQIFLMTEQWILSAIFSYSLLLVWTLYLSWSRSCCTISFRLYSIMKNSILKVFSK